MENNRETETQAIVQDALTHLVRMKSTLEDRLLIPAGVPAEIYDPAFVFLPTETLTQVHRQQAAAQIVTAILALPARRALMYRLLDLIIAWTDFDLAEEPHTAQAIVRRARRLADYVQFSQPLADLRAELDLHTEVVPHTASADLKPISPPEELLLQMWQDSLAQSDPAIQTWLVQDLLNRLFLLNEITQIRRFQPTPDNRAVDGVIQLAGVNYPIEARWRPPYEPAGATPAIQLFAQDISSVLSGSQNLRALLEARISRP